MNHTINEEADEIQERGSEALEDMRCPTCGNYESFEIHIGVYFCVNKHGPKLDENNDLCFDDLSDCRCSDCGETGTVQFFKQLCLEEGINGASVNQFDAGQQFDSPEEAVALILAQGDHIEALIAVVQANIEYGEFGFASEVVREFAGLDS